MPLHFLDTVPNYDQSIHPSSYFARKDNLLSLPTPPTSPPPTLPSPARLAGDPNLLHPAPLDHTAYPHVLDLVLSFAPYDALPTLRLVSRHLHEYASARLYVHVAIAVLHPQKGSLARGDVTLTDPVHRRRIPGLRWRPWPERYYPITSDASMSGSAASRKPEPEPTAEMLQAREQHARTVARMQAHTRILDNFNLYAGSICSRDWADLTALVRPETIVRTAKFLGIDVPRHCALQIAFGDLSMCYPRASRCASLNWWENPTHAWVNNWSSARVVLSMRYVPRDPHLRWRGLNFARVRALDELVILFRPYTSRMLETFVPDHDARAHRGTPRRVLGMLHSMVGAMACNLPARETTWTLVGLENADLHSLELEGSGDWASRREIIRHAIEEAVMERDWTRPGFTGDWDRGEGDIRVPPLRLLTVDEWRAEVGEEVFGLSTDQPEGMHDILHPKYL
ncbi:uncharacterized protein LOC62_07G008909 [Vanrija pseudolonga]|uniref:Uncharacterized protein n=1 Tax=Vanrija pseudolonga TaxID=143232 RepID=A0AAF1BPF4_9TREE|nr:hypothetical protein LOC62_07G008909 [Vanrija pseudolonga]